MKPVPYPTTPHLPYSGTSTRADKVLTSVEHFVGKIIVRSTKMDGENANLYRTGTHARSVDSRHHPSRDWLKGYHASLAHEIPDNWRICGENLFARHSLAYETLPSYFMAFSVWDENNVSLSWKDTVDFCEMLGIPLVPHEAPALFDDAQLQKYAKTMDTSKDEGFVIRLADAIPYEQFGMSVAKWVRPNHVQTDEHWMHAAVVPNGLAR